MQAKNIFRRIREPSRSLLVGHKSCSLVKKRLEAENEEIREKRAKKRKKREGRREEKRREEKRREEKRKKKEERRKKGEGRRERRGRILHQDHDMHELA